MKKTMCLPITLFISLTPAYGMDSEDALSTSANLEDTINVVGACSETKNEATDLRRQSIDEKKHSVLALNVVQSMVFRDITAEDLEKNKKASEDKAAQELSKSLASRGYITSTLFYLRPIKTLITEINSGNFMTKNHANSQYLTDGIKTLLSKRTHENLEALYQVLYGCKKQKIDIKDTDLITSVRAYTKTMRTQDELTLSNNVITVAKNAQTSRTEIINEFKKTLIDLKSRMEATVKKLNTDLDTACVDKAHIKKSTEVKMLARNVCPTLKDDGYTSEQNDNSKRSFEYDLSDIMLKLDLTEKVDSLKERNRRVIANFTALLDSVIPTMDSVILVPARNNASTQLVNQQQS
jgi:hypothetical protein